MSTFAFDTLNPVDRDTFELPDGVLVEFRNRTDFSAGEQVTAEKLHQAIEGLRNTAKKSANPKVLTDLVKKQQEFVKVILPDMPDKVLEGFSAGQISVIVEWWTNKQAERFNEGGSPNGRGRG
jgi:hypothetical protein